MWHRFLLAGLLSVSSCLAAFDGKVEEVELREHTQFTLRLVPRLGTRLVFPFLLDDANLKPPLNYKLTNAIDFSVTRDLGLLAGQNVFLITCSERDKSIGKLYMSIGGYNLAINLVISHEVKDHISDIFLMLGEDDRNFLINQEIEKIKQQLQNLYHAKYENRQGADYEQLALLLLKRARRKNIKQLYYGSKESFQTADIFLDKFIYQAPLLYGLHFWLEHYQAKFNLSSMVVRFQQDRGIDALIEGHFFCFEEDKRLDQCIFISEDELLIANQGRLLITLINDKDEIFNFAY